MSGTLGALDTKQEHALAQMRQKILCIQDAPIQEYARKFCDDSILLRFLRARQFAANPAFEMLVNTLTFRTTFQGIGIEGITRASVNNEINAGKAYYYKEDREGRPVCYIKVRNHIPSQFEPMEGQRFTIYMMEYGRSLLKPPIETVTMVFDMSDSGVKNVDLKNLQFMINTLQCHYPESLGKVLVYNAPWFVHGVWKVVKPWLDAVTAAKVVFIEKKNMPAYIPSENLPVEYGGADTLAYNAEAYGAAMEKSILANALNTKPPAQ